MTERRYLARYERLKLDQLLMDIMRDVAEENLNSLSISLYQMNEYIKTLLAKRLAERTVQETGVLSE